MSKEIELKLAIAPAALNRLSAHPDFQQFKTEKSTRKQLFSKYFDTKDHTLRQAGISLRIRRDGAQFIQTIKSHRDFEALVMNCNEWEFPVPDLGKLDFTHAQITALAPLIETHDQRAAIQPLFTVSVDREILLLKYSNSIIEIALDHGRVSAGPKARQFAEVELELKSGSSEDLYALAREIAAIVTVRPSTRSKADRGFDLLNERTPQVTKAQPIILEEGTSTGEAFRIIARSCLKQFLTNEEVLRQTRVAGAVHQARVGLRRLRAAISVFRSIVDDDERAFISNELRWIANCLGEARDIDVYIKNILEPAKAKHAEDPAFIALAEKYAIHRERAYDSAQRAISSRRSTQAIIATIAWVEAGPWTCLEGKKAKKKRQQPIRKFASKQLDRRWNKIIKRATHLSSLEAEARHEVRISLKKLRYASEFFAGLFLKDEANKPFKAAISSMTKLQDLLGELNDIAVGRERETHSEAEDQLRDEHAADEHKLLSKAEKAYKDFAHVPPFWRAED